MMEVKTLIFISFFFFLFCAKTGFPPGGPDDKIPPEIIRTSPVNGALHVNQKTNVEIVFNEHIRSNITEDAIYISPFPGDDVKYKWKGKKLKIDFPDTLKPSRTYVITIGTKITDLRNNALPETFILAFSTGDRLDQGHIKGSVEAEKTAQGIGVWAYILDNENDLNPAEMMPDYEVQCDARGKFEFYNLAAGNYRLFAVQDRFGDRLYQQGEDAIGIPYKDIKLIEGDSTTFPEIFLKTFTEDTLNPTLQRVRAIHSQYCIAQFDEDIQEVSDCLKKHFHIFEKEDSTQFVEINRIYQDSKNHSLFHIYIDTLIAGVYYDLKSNNLTDLGGNPLDSLYDRVSFQGIEMPDTLAPNYVEINPQHMARHVLLDMPVHIIFSEALDTASFEHAFTFSDTTGDPVSGFFEWQNPADVVFYPDDFLVSEKEYRMKVDSLSASDINENYLVDTLVSFTSVNQDTFAEISGILLDQEAQAAGNIVIQARLFSPSKKIYETTLMESGPYVISDALPGQYILSAFRDSDEDGRYSYGQAFPYHPSERFTIYQDTVKTRSRWTSEGNDFELPVLTDSVFELD